MRLNKAVLSPSAGGNQKQPRSHGGGSFTGQGVGVGIENQSPNTSCLDAAGLEAARASKEKLGPPTVDETDDHGSGYHHDDHGSGYHHDDHAWLGLPHPYRHPHTHPYTHARTGVRTHACTRLLAHTHALAYQTLSPRYTSSTAIHPHQGWWATVRAWRWLLAFRLKSMNSTKRLRLRQCLRLRLRQGLRLRHAIVQMTPTEVGARARAHTHTNTNVHTHKRHTRSHSYPYNLTPPPPPPPAKPHT